MQVIVTSIIVSLTARYVCNRTLIHYPHFSYSILNMYFVLSIFNKLIKHKCYNNTNINGKTLIQSMTYNSGEKIFKHHSNPIRNK